MDHKVFVGVQNNFFRFQFIFLGWYENLATSFHSKDFFLVCSKLSVHDLTSTTQS